MNLSPRSPDRSHRTDQTDAEGFWRFAVAAWEQPHLREPLLRWQEQHRIDVIFLLFACWLARPLPPQHWAHLRTASLRWHVAVTRRIRNLRRRIGKVYWPAGYEGLLALELASERMEATWLGYAVGKSRGPMQRRNLELRIGRLFPDLHPEERRDFLAAIRPLL